MAERAAHLLDRVFPDVPVCQCRGPQRGNRAGVEWVLSLPYRLRYQLSRNHHVCRGVVPVFVCAVFRCLRARAPVATDSRGSAVAVIQRFGGVLNLNVHVHALVLDGVFARSPVGAVAIHPTQWLTAVDVEEVLAAVEPGIRRLL